LPARRTGRAEHRSPNNKGGTNYRDAPLRTRCARAGGKTAGDYTMPCNTSHTHTPPTPTCGCLTVAQFARHYHVGGDKVRLWIKQGELKALNISTSPLGKPRYVITPEAVADFERRRDAGPAPQPPKRRRKKSYRYYPDPD
jgi:hypothetical protein